MQCATAGARAGSSTWHSCHCGPHAPALLAYLADRCQTQLQQEDQHMGRIDVVLRGVGAWRDADAAPAGSRAGTGAGSTTAATAGLAAAAGTPGTTARRALSTDRCRDMSARMCMGCAHTVSRSAFCSTPLISSVPNRDAVASDVNTLCAPLLLQSLCAAAAPPSGARRTSPARRAVPAAVARAARPHRPCRPWHWTR